MPRAASCLDGGCILPRVIETPTVQIAAASAAVYAASAASVSAGALAVSAAANAALVAEVVLTQQRVTTKYLL